MKKLGKDRLFLIIVSLYISGIISSFLLISPEKISIKDSEVTVLGILYTFTLNSFKYLLIISLIELILFIPMFIILSYRSIMISFKGQRMDRYAMENYNKLLFVSSIVIFIYSVLLEIVGAMYG